MTTRLIIFGLACLLGPMTTYADESAEKDSSKADECFQTKRVHTIKRLDDLHVVAELLGGKRYVLGVEARCKGLQKAVTFTVTSRGTRVCPASFAELIFAERSGRSDGCRIETVELLAEDGEAAKQDAVPEGERPDA